VEVAPQLNGDRPRVSICLTTYKRGRVLARSIESILSQTYRDYELIISDDTSPDNTQEVCRQYAAKDERISYFRNAINLKMPGNLNAAISHARGEYIANLHDGDTYRQDLIEKWVGALDKYPSAAFVFNAVEVVDYKGNHIHTYQHTYPPLIRGQVLLDEMLGQWNSPVWGTVMVRRACYRAVGPFDARFGFVSDIDMWMRLASRYDVSYIGEPLLRITPREADHPYAFISWELNRTLEEIHRVNLQRRYAGSPPELEKALRRMRWRRDRSWIHDLAVCLKNGRVDKLLEGLRLFRTSDSPFLRSLGVFASPLEMVLKT
jgi:glycosyltransferase involved in cell wall biosynthesis